jgi:hypothetical protein
MTFSVSCPCRIYDVTEDVWQQAHFVVVPCARHRYDDRLQRALGKALEDLNRQERRYRGEQSSSSARI